MNFSYLARNFIRNYMFRRTRIGRSTFKKMLRPLIPCKQTVQLEPGISMHLDLSKTNHEFLFWFYEEHESSLQWAIKTLLPARGTFIDCGANLGLMGLLAIHSRQAQVVFIEPHPRLARMIKQNLELNHFASFGTVCEAAASDKDGTGFLHIDSRSDGGHSLTEPPEHQDEPRIEVKTRKLMGLLNELSIHHIDLLKIDTEGHDFNAVTGLGSFLHPKNIDLIYIEMWGNYTGIWNLLMERGYRPFASDTIYIDRLRELVRKNDASHFFCPVEKPGDGNLLWCARASTYEAVLLRTCNYIKDRTSNQ